MDRRSEGMIDANARKAETLAEMYRGFAEQFPQVPMLLQAPISCTLGPL